MKQALRPWKYAHENETGHRELPAKLRVGFPNVAFVYCHEKYFLISTHTHFLFLSLLEQI
jgi:hypothetical protein